jgi:uracil-DNA glycosylase
MQNVHGREQFLAGLREALNPHANLDDVEVLYDYSDEGERRWQNLSSYLEYMEVERPDLLMVGEAPGYRGSSVSGVPFLSEDTIRKRQNAALRLPIYEYTPVTPESRWGGYEATSTFMWDTIDAVNPPKLPFLWATFPNHPHESGNVYTNRRPNTQEVADYISIIGRIANYYAIGTIVAIGNVAYDTLVKTTSSPIVKLRHPARGGVQRFRQGFLELTEKIYGES